VLATESEGATHRLSSDSNPLESFPQPGYIPTPPPLPLRRKSDEDPPWSGWDVVMITGVAIASMIVFEAAVTFVAKLLVYKNLPLLAVAQIPELALLAQLLIYAAIFGAMFATVAVKAGKFWQPVSWQWPSQWLVFLLGGALLYFALLGVSQLLPVPKHLPIDRFFKTAREAALMSVLATALAPLMEELFFRGFLYPVLARRLGVMASIFLTGAAFGIVHGAQLGYSWPVLIIFVVGLALTIVRAITKSVAASFLVHVGYNGTLSLLMYVVTGGFRHLEKLNQ